MTKTNDAGELQQSVEDTLKQRGRRYGKFKNHAVLSKRLREAFFTHQKIFGITALEPYQEEAIIMVCHKLARIANGSPDYDDSWRDIAGYTQLVVDELEKKK